MKQYIYAGVLSLAFLTSACDKPESTPDLLQAAGQSSVIWNGVATSKGRVFVCFSRNDGSAGTRIGELLADGSVQPYPNAEWNSWTTAVAASGRFVRTNSIRFGPDGYLWIVDTGTPKTDAAPVANGPKLIAIDITTNQIVKSIGLDDVARQNSFIDDLRFNGSFIYVTDAGAPAIIVHDLSSGQSRRVLENDSSTTQRRPLYGEGKILLKPNGEQVKLHADQMEVSPDGAYYYFQTAAGPMYRLPTSALNNVALSSTELAKQVQYFFNSPTTGGTAMDAEGNIYLNDANQKRMLKITPAGQSSVVIQDERLVWGDAMWIDEAGYIWIPAPQQNRTPEFQQGVSTVQYPVKLYKMQLGVQPLRR